ncbi:hypothetical protein [Halorubrum tebenquichense]|uniref:Uncharacterized protein n=1 Tax=Halorubrum tebenquichense DSM 14210 TaxID=1227485 RepID=M0DVH7_9EURY|nr:hypothetical protein [Halorubrum tebenquichense]ELZ39500.1 hypothetical protein C472_04278 [Halorubrum tebenquichense DSM 14210]
MNRRRFAAALLTAGTVPLAGCAGDGEWNPTVDGDTPTIPLGEEATVTVSATDIGGFNFRPPPDGITIGTAASERSVSPPPDSGEDSYPPRWFWSRRTDVTVGVPIAVAETADPGEYQY